MSSFAARQLAVLEGRLSAYAEGGMSLNALITDIEGLAGIVENKALSEQVYPFLFDLEVINACHLADLEEMDVADGAQEKALSPDDVEEINALLAEIKQLFHDCLAGDGA